jgi:hypothetical protein
MEYRKDWYHENINHKNKIMKQSTGPRLLMFIGIVAITFFGGCSSGNQVSSTATPLQLTQAIDNDQWIFSADHASPVYGRSRNLSGSYFVKCNKHELTVALPYYGQLTSTAGAYGGNPLDFSSAEFKLSKENAHNSRWTVTIESPNPEVRSMVFSFYDNGNAQLNVIMTNRSGISFTGKVYPS